MGVLHLLPCTTRRRYWFNVASIVGMEGGGSISPPPPIPNVVTRELQTWSIFYTSFTKFCNITKIPFIYIQIEFWKIFIRVKKNNNNLYTKQSYTKPRDVAIDVTPVVTRSFEFCGLIQDNPT